MRVISLISSKGGVGKSTLTVNIAVEATRRGLAALIIDLDSQATSWTWGQARGPDSPLVIGAQAPALPSLLEQAEAQGIDLVVVDTPPRADSIGVQAARVSDLILIPCQPSSFDLGAMRASLMAAEIAGKRGTIILNGAVASSSITAGCLAALREGAAPLAPVQLGLRMDYRHPLGEGRAASEWDAKGKAALEVAALWDWIRRQPGMAQPRREVAKVQRKRGAAA